MFRDEVDEAGQRSGGHLEHALELLVQILILQTAHTPPHAHVLQHDDLLAEEEGGGGGGGEGGGEGEGEEEDGHIFLKISFNLGWLCSRVVSVLD